MHLIQNYSETVSMKKAAMASAPFGPGFSDEQVNKASWMEVWGTGINDPGPDYTEFRLRDISGTVVATARIDGY